MKDGNDVKASLDMPFSKESLMVFAIIVLKIIVVLVHNAQR